MGLGSLHLLTAVTPAALNMGVQDFFSSLSRFIVARNPRLPDTSVWDVSPSVLSVLGTRKMNPMGKLFPQTQGIPVELVSARLVQLGNGIFCQHFTED